MNGFIKRSTDPTSGSTLAIYELTAYSATLKSIVSSLSEWGTMHRAKIKNT